MSVDDRLRGALSAQAEAFAPRVEDALDRVRVRSRRERWRNAAVGMAASAAAVAAVVGSVVALDGIWTQEPPTVGRPSPSITTATDTAPALRGSLTGDVVQPDVLAGRWTLQLNGNGSMGVSPPPGFGGEVSGPVFTADGSSFRTMLFGEDRCAGHGTGIYDWLRVGDRIEFDTVSDTCATRTRFFAGSTWTVSTGTTPRD